MSAVEKLRPVKVNFEGKQVQGHFHRFAYRSSEFQSETQVLVELEDGRLMFFDPFFVRFTDRDIPK